MAGQLGRFQMLSSQSFKGLTKNNHIGSIYRAQPQKATEIMVQLLATHRGKTLENYLMQFPTKYFATDDDYTWEVIGSSRRNIPLVEARHDDGTPVDGVEFAGVAGAPFFLVFAEDWFADGEVIVGEKNEVYPLRVLGEARAEGSNYVYRVETMGGLTTGVPAEELAANKRFSWEFAPVEHTRSKGVGGVRYTTPVAMRNEWTTIRIKERVPGNMLNKKLAVGIPVIDKGGKKVVHSMWMHHVEFMIEQTWGEYKCNALMYGKSNRNSNGEYLNFGKSGEVIKMGDGIRAQMEVANTDYYNEFNLALLENALYDISASKLEFGDRKFVLRTGERGASLFNKAVKDTVSGWYALGYSGDNNASTVTKTSSKLHSNALSAGYQFTEYKAPNGLVISIEVDPLYDDPVRNKILHPDGGVAESYRFDLMYIGTMDQPNVQLCKIQGQEEIRGYMWGLRNPFTGAMNNDNMSFDTDEAEMHRLTTLGCFVLDPTRTVSLIPAILG